VRRSATTHVRGADRLGCFVAEFRADELDPQVKQAARLLLLDTLGCALAAQGLSVLDGAANVMVAQGGRSDATIIGAPARVSMANAALANGVRSHALDFDDIHPPSSAHTSTVICPAALAAGEACGAAGGNLLAAIALGTEVAARIGSIVPTGLHERGFHVTSIAGVFGAAAAASYLCGASAEQTRDALGIAGSLASGIFAYLDDGTQTKPLHAGWAAHGGVLAAEFAASGVSGPPSVLEGRYGLFDTFLRGAFASADARAQAVSASLDDLGSAWRTLEVTPKVYPCCAFMHPWLDAAQRLLRGEELRAGDIVTMHVEVPTEIAARLVDPLGRTASPGSGYDAKFSLPFALASLVQRGTLDLDAFAEEAINDPAITSLAHRLTVRTFDQQDWATSPHGLIEVTTVSGDVRASAVGGDTASSTALNRAEAVVAKFMTNASHALDEDRSAAIQDEVLTLAHDTPLTCLCGLLGAASHTGEHACRRVTS